MESPTTRITLFYFTTIKTKSLITPTTLFNFTTIKIKSLTALSTLFYFTTNTTKSVTVLTTLFSSLLFKWNLSLRSLPGFISLLLK